MSDMLLTLWCYRDQVSEAISVNVYPIYDNLMRMGFVHVCYRCLIFLMIKLCIFGFDLVIRIRFVNWHCFSALKVSTFLPKIRKTHARSFISLLQFNKMCRENPTLLFAAPTSKICKYSFINTKTEYPRLKRHVVHLKGCRIEWATGILRNHHRYRQQVRLKKASNQKRPEFECKHQKIILIRHNARSRCKTAQK